jgi:Rieske 2Fe-2S family protein
LPPPQSRAAPLRNIRPAPLVRCPYHNWTYHLDGTLNKAPGFGDRALPDFDPEDNGLIRLAAAEWHGLIFVHGSSEPVTPFADHVAGLDTLVAPYEMGRLRVGGHHEYTVAANWKVLNENYQECYHCPAIHPELCRVSPPESGENYLHPHAGAWVGGWQEMRDGALTMSFDGTTSARPLPALDAEQRRQVIYVGVFPNLLVSLHPDYVMTHLLTPLAADRTRIQCRWAFAPEDLDRPDFDPAFAVDFWDVPTPRIGRPANQCNVASPTPPLVPAFSRATRTLSTSLSLWSLGATPGCRSPPPRRIDENVTTKLRSWE